jgi:hypothetical protein
MVGPVVVGKVGPVDVVGDFILLVVVPPSEFGLLSADGVVVVPWGILLPLLPLPVPIASGAPPRNFAPSTLLGGSPPEVVFPIITPLHPFATP